MSVLKAIFILTLGITLIASTTFAAPGFSTGAAAGYGVYCENPTPDKCGSGDFTKPKDGCLCCSTWKQAPHGEYWYCDNDNGMVCPGGWFVTKTIYCPQGFTSPCYLCYPGLTVNKPNSEF